LGATPIGSAGRAPDEDENIGSNAWVNIDFIISGKQPDNKLDILLPSGGGGDSRLVEKATRWFWALKQLNKALNKNLILKSRPPR
jgi:hypothetical protein